MARMPDDELRIDRDRVTVELSGDELEILNNALDEVCNGLDIREFAIRMGAEKPEREPDRKSSRPGAARDSLIVSSLCVSRAAAAWSGGAYRAWHRRA